MKEVNGRLGNGEDVERKYKVLGTEIYDHITAKLCEKSQIIMGSMILEDIRRDS
jgi:hypothetical protein